MKFIYLLLLVVTLSSCESDKGPNVQAECKSSDSNELAGCWLYERCYPSIDFPGSSRRVGVALGENGIVNAQFTYFYDSPDCSINQNGFGIFTFAGTYSTHDTFVNSNGLEVTEFHYITNSSIVKTTYYYLNNNRLCFPLNTFVGDSNENDITRLDDNVSYNELSEQLDLTECFVPVNHYEF